jgi:hypothetical protein
MPIIYVSYIIGMSAIYDRIQAITNLASRRKAIKSLSDSNKKEYIRHQTNLRQRKYMSDPVNRVNAYLLNNVYRQSVLPLIPGKSVEYKRRRTAYMRSYRASKGV